MGNFEIALDRLTEVPVQHAFEASAGWWAQREAEGENGACRVETAFRFELEVARIRDQIVLEGEMVGRVGLECSRCAKRYSHALRDSVRLVLSPAEDREAADPEGAQSLAATGLCLAGEDLEAGWFRGAVIRLDDFFGELIALAMPLQPLCRSDCRGICSGCGVDLSEALCRCVDEKIDSPFAALAKLKGVEE
jgi:uncharacterized protein